MEAGAQGVSKGRGSVFVAGRFQQLALRGAFFAVRRGAARAAPAPLTM